MARWTPAFWVLLLAVYLFPCPPSLAYSASSHAASAPTRQAITIRGQQQMLYLYGPPGGTPVILSSGDGGWIHLAPHVVDVLAANGYFVVGLDIRSYLSSFTSGTSSLRPEDEPGDYLVLAQFAARTSPRKPILIGVSEGAGLSVLAATDPRTKAAIAGVIGLGLPDVNELAWRTRDMLIYLTHGIPNEPRFSAAAIVDRVAPLPLAVIHSTRDEFVAVNEIERLLQAASAPKQLWLINASNHRFEDKLEELNQRLLEAIAWVIQHTPAQTR
jgi:alpha-beta hydrolase superfamily lysophospholipase